MKCLHSWHKKEGERVRMPKAIGRSPTVRVCTQCGRIQEYLNTRLMTGWWDASPYAAGCAKAIVARLMEAG